MPQVRPEHYRTEDYNSVERFCSYAYQLKLIAELDVDSVLEVGPGNFLVADALKRRGYRVTTCDFDSEVEADFTADARELPFEDNTYDVVVACQVLEHLPFEDFGKSLGELTRVCRKYVVVSFPRSCSECWLVWRLPWIRTLTGKNHAEIAFAIPRKFKGFENHGQHYWEIGKSTPLRLVRSKVNRIAKVIKECSPVMMKTHYFFVAQKRGS